jgi:hypothetical protein
MTQSLEIAIMEEVRKLDPTMQRHVLAVVRGLAEADQPTGEPGWRFMQAARNVQIDPEDLERCEQVA